MDYPAIFIYGDPRYYSRFGFDAPKNMISKLLMANLRLPYWHWS